MRFWNNLHRVRDQNRKIEKPNNLKLWEQKIKGPKQNSQSRLRSRMHEGGEPY